MLKSILWICLLTVLDFAPLVDASGGTTQASAETTAQPAAGAEKSLDYSFEYDFAQNIAASKDSFLTECTDAIKPEAKCEDVKAANTTTVLSVKGTGTAIDTLTKTVSSAGLVLPNFKLPKGTPIFPEVTKDLTFDYDYTNIGLQKDNFLKECSEALTPVTCKDVKKVSVVTELTISGPEPAVLSKIKELEANGFKLPSFGQLGSPKVAPKEQNLPTEEIKFDVDFDATVGTKKNQFLEECSAQLKPLKCVDVKKGSVIVKIAGSPDDLKKGMSDLKSTGLSLPTFKDLGKGEVIEPIQMQEVSFNKDFAQVVGSDKDKFLLACNARYKTSNVTCEDMRSGSVILRLKGVRNKLNEVVDGMASTGLTLAGTPFGVGTKLGVITTTVAPFPQNTPETPQVSTEGPANKHPAQTTSPATTTTTKFSTLPPIDIAKWGYPARNDEWGGLCEKGDSQSPIDLPELTSAQSQYPLVEYMQYRKVAMIGVDSGVGLKWNPKKGEPALGYITLENAKFNLMYWTIHAGSEHTSNKKQFDIEIQFYHKSDFGKLVVVSVLCSVMPLKEASTFWTQIRNGMSDATDVDPMLLFQDVTFDTSRRFEYEGSMTTPPCDQGISWIVLAEQCAVPHDFYKYATSFDSMQDNFRPPQPIGKRRIKATSGVFSSSWGYPAKNDEWGGTCLGGKMQSPIDFDLEVMTSMKKSKDILKDVTGGERRFYGHDTGHSLKWKPNTKGSGIKYKGSLWKLQQFHLHTKSEHTIAGGQYDMEIVFVHKNDQGRLLNIAVLCKGEDFGQSTFFEGLRDSMTGDGKSKGFVTDYKEDVLKQLGDTTQYMRYIGSITVPPCSEGVEWIVMGALLSVPTDFLIWLKQFKSMKYNFRPPQPLNDRIIYTSGEGVSVAASLLNGYTTTQIIQLVSGVGLLIVGLFILLDCRISWKAPRSDEIPLLGA